ncbi:MAG: YebC/PmpR family DNA-binding transcriptional regulator [Bacillota bacterium]
MAGHSKWAQIKRRKAKVDAQKGKVFTRLAREIIIAAREGGGDPDANPRLKAAIQRAKEANIPNENIARAIQKGTGELGGGNYEIVHYEGYGPGGVAILVRTLTDNRNRTAAEIRHLFSKHGGNLGEAGCVAWMFEPRGLIIVDRENLDLTEDDLILAVMEAGGEDLKPQEDSFEVLTAPEELNAVKAKLIEQGIPVAEAQVTMLPKNTVALTGEESERLSRLIDFLEELDDVDEVYTNLQPSE